MSATRWVKILSGPAAAALFYASLDLGPENEAARTMAAVVIWMAVWWVTEAIHIAITALLPVVLFPLLGLMDAREVSSQYFNQVIFLFIGGFMIAFAMERWGLHKRIAYKIILSMQGTPHTMLFGFMFVCWFLSMWMSNTATVLMLLPALLAILIQFDHAALPGNRTVATGFLLGLAYAGSIGGTATLVGTPPNLILLGFYQERFPDSNALSFGNWFMFGLPLSFAFLCICYALLRRMYLRPVYGLRINLDESRAAYNALGPMSFEEKIVATVFTVTALLWLFREDLDFGAVVIRGWSNAFASKRFIHDSTVAMTMGVLMFILPTRSGRGGILTWEEMKKLPYGILLLFGGGFALARGVETSGLSNVLAGSLSGLGTLHVVWLVIGLCCFMTFLTEFTSNVASLQLVLPFVYAMAMTVDAHPLMLLLPITISSSFAFMLPIATAPNAIVYGSDRLRIRDMARTGLVLNLTGMLLVTLAMFTLGKWVFGL